MSKEKAEQNINYSLTLHEKMKDRIYFIDDKVSEIRKMIDEIDEKLELIKKCIWKIDDDINDSREALRGEKNA